MTVSPSFPRPRKPRVLRTLSHIFVVVSTNVVRLGFYPNPMRGRPGRRRVRVQSAKGIGRRVIPHRPRGKAPSG